MDEDNNPHRETSSQRNKRISRAARWAAKTGVMAATGTLAPTLAKGVYDAIKNTTQHNTDNINPKPLPEDDQLRTIGKKTKIEFGQKEGSFSVSEGRDENIFQTVQQTISEKNQGGNVKTTRETTQRPPEPTPMAATPSETAPVTDVQNAQKINAANQPITTANENTINASPIAVAYQKLKSFQDSKAGKTTSRVAKKVLMYTTPGGFIAGKFGLRIAERQYAKRATQQIKETASKTAETGKKGAKTGVGAVKKAFLWSTPLGWAIMLGKKYLPQNTKDKIAKPISSLSKRQDPTAYQRAWNDAALSKNLWKRFRKPAFLSRFQNSRAWKIGKWGLSPAFFGAKKVFEWKRARYVKNNSGKWVDEYMNAYKSPEKHRQNPQNNDRQQARRARQFAKRQAVRAWKGYTKTLRWTTPIGPWNKFVSPRLSQLNRGLGRKINTLGRNNLKSAAKSGAKRAGKQLGKQLAKQAISQGVRTFFASPAGWVTIGVILAIILIIAMVIVIITAVSGGGGESGGGFGGNPPPTGGLPTAPPIPGITLTLTAPDAVDNGIEIPYTVTVIINTPNLTVPIESITIYEDLPPGTDYVYTTGDGTFDPINKRVSWSLQAEQNRNSFSFVLRPTQDNTVIQNRVYALTSSTGNLVTTNNCNGFYALDNPVGNFGDPNCNFSTNNAQAKSDLYDLLRSQDPIHADYWYLSIIPCESSYNPNSYLAASQSGLGAYGLFQMNPTGRGNSQYDAGDVNWPQQVPNAIAYNKLIGESFGYWGCAN